MSSRSSHSHKHIHRKGKGKSEERSLIHQPNHLDNQEPRNGGANTTPLQDVDNVTVAMGNLNTVYPASMQQQWPVSSVAEPSERPDYQLHYAFEQPAEPLSFVQNPAAGPSQLTRSSGSSGGVQTAYQASTTHTVQPLVQSSMLTAYQMPSRFAGTDLHSVAPSHSAPLHITQVATADVHRVASHPYEKRREPYEGNPIDLQSEYGQQSNLHNQEYSGNVHPLQQSSFPHNSSACICESKDGHLCRGLKWPKPDRPKDGKIEKKHSSHLKSGASKGKGSSSSSGLTAQGSDGTNCGALYMPGITPSPKPKESDPDYEKEIKHWNKKRETWKDITCGCGFGYFNDDGIWVSGAAVRAWLADPPNSEVQKVGNPRWKKTGYHIPEGVKFGKGSLPHALYDVTR